MKMLYRLALFVLRWAHVASFRVAYFCPTVVNQDSISRNEVHFIVKTVESLRKVGYSQTFLYTEAESRLQLAHSLPTITEMSYVQVHIGSDGKLVGLKQSYDIFFALMREALPKLHGIASIFNVLVHHASNIIWHKKIAHKKQLLSSFDLVLLEHENWRRIFMKHMKRVLKKLQPSRLLRPLSVEAIVRMNGKDTDYNNFFSKRLYTLVQNAVYINRYRAVVQGNWTKLVDARLVAAPPGSTEKVAILFEREFNPLALLSVKSLMWKLGSSWGLKVFHGFNNRGYLKSLFSGISNVDFNWLPEGQTVNSILKSKYFWRNIEERHALIFHSDSLMLKGDVERFFKFDFIGAPASISMAKINRPALLNFSSELATSRKPYKDFESSEYLIGKFSLRNVSAMRMITSMFWSPREESEDVSTPFDYFDGNLSCSVCLANEYFYLSVLPSYIFLGI